MIKHLYIYNPKLQEHEIMIIESYLEFFVINIMLSNVKDYFFFYVKCYYELKKKEDSYRVFKASGRIRIFSKSLNFKKYCLRINLNL